MLEYKILLYTFRRSRPSNDINLIYVLFIHCTLNVLVRYEIHLLKNLYIVLTLFHVQLLLLVYAINHFHFLTFGPKLCITLHLLVFTFIFMIEFQSGSLLVRILLYYTRLLISKFSTVEYQMDTVQITYCV